MPPFNEDAQRRIGRSVRKTERSPENPPTNRGRWGGSRDIRFIQIDGAHSLDTVLDCYLGTWNPATHDISYDTATAYKCIDRRANVPTADNDAEGIAIPFGSDSYGTIWFILDLDCPA